MKKRIADMEPEVDVFVLREKRWKPTNQRLKDFPDWIWCTPTGGGKAEFFHEGSDHEVIGRIGPDGKFEIEIDEEVLKMAQRMISDYENFELGGIESPWYPLQNGAKRENRNGGMR